MAHFCYLCDDPLTESNISDEHIIPNCIGGRLKLKTLVCAECNKKTGELYDGILAKIGNVLASRFNIKRSRGIVPNYIASEIETGKEVIVSPGNKVNYLHPEHGEEDGVPWVHAHNEKRLLQEIERIKKDLKTDKYSFELIKMETININRKITFYTEEALEPDLLLRSVCKTMINFYIYKTNDRVSVDRVIEFLRSDIENMVAWFLNLNICKTYHAGSPYHVLIIKGDIKQKALYGYYEIFGIRGFAILLNGRYSGPELMLSYTFDPVNAKEIESSYLQFNMSVTDLITLIYNKQGLDFYDPLQ